MQIIMMSYVSLIHVNGHILMGSYQNLSMKTKLNPIICLYYWTIWTNGSNYDCEMSHFMGGCDALSTMLQPFLSQFNLMRKSTFFGHYENWFQSLPLFLGGGTNFCVSNGKSTMTQDLKMELEKTLQSVNRSTNASHLAQQRNQCTNQRAACSLFSNKACLLVAINSIY